MPSAADARKPPIGVLRVKVACERINAAQTIDHEAPRKPIGYPQVRIFAQSAFVAADTVQRTWPVGIVGRFNCGPKLSWFVREF